MSMKRYKDGNGKTYHDTIKGIEMEMRDQCRPFYFHNYVNVKICYLRIEKNHFGRFLITSSKIDGF